MMVAEWADHHRRSGLLSTMAELKIVIDVLRSIPSIWRRAYKVSTAAKLVCRELEVVVAVK